MQRRARRLKRRLDCPISSTPAQEYPLMTSFSPCTFHVLSISSWLGHGKVLRTLGSLPWRGTISIYAFDTSLCFYDPVSVSFYLDDCTHRLFVRLCRGGLVGFLMVHDGVNQRHIISTYCFASEPRAGFAVAFAATSAWFFAHGAVAYNTHSIQKHCKL
jgi:hypothetical protein